MTEENNAFPMSRVLLILSVLSFILMMGGCCSCIGSSKTEYGEEEFYQKPLGGVGYGAKSNTTGGDPTLAIIGGVVGILSLFGSGIASAFEETKLPAEGERKAEQFAAEEERRAEQFASMSLNELESRLEWEFSLSSLSIEQLEKQMNEFRLITNPTQEDNWRQMILAKVIALKSQ
jgi:hypothetical protein